MVNAFLTYWLASNACMLLTILLLGVNLGIFVGFLIGWKLKPQESKTYNFTENVQSPARAFPSQQTVVSNATMVELQSAPRVHVDNTTNLGGPNSSDWKSPRR